MSGDPSGVNGKREVIADPRGRQTLTLHLSPGYRSYRSYQRYRSHYQTLSNNYRIR